MNGRRGTMNTGGGLAQTGRRVLAMLTLIAMTLVHVSAQARVDVCYSGGPLLPNFKLNGNGTLDGSSLVVTRSVGNQGSSISYNTPLSTSSDVHIKMRIRISENGNGGADGMAFVMHNDPSGASALGALGGGIGYAGLTNSVTVEFDTYNNGAGDRNNANHIAITRDGNVNCGSPTPANCFGYLSLSTVGIDLKTASSVYLWIDRNGTTNSLQVYIATTDSKPGLPQLSATVNVPSIVGSQMYLTFTGSTGGSWSKHEIMELYASDSGATANEQCCVSDTDCGSSILGGVCDPVKKSCGPCSLEDTSGCAPSLQACDLSRGTNECIHTCDGDNGASSTYECASGFFPSCSGSGPTNGSCVTCDGDYTKSGAAFACPSGAPSCLTNGFCGRCTSNADCGSEANLGSICTLATGRCRACASHSECAGGQYCASNGHCTAQEVTGDDLPPGAVCPADGVSVCESGECNVDAQTCSDPNGSGCVDAAECTSNLCGQDSSCGCSVDADCASSEFCSFSARECLDKLLSGGAIPSDGLHDGTCSEANADAVCESGECNTTTDTCASDDGSTCSAANQCVSNTCTSGHCVPDTDGCWIDANCGSEQYCDRATLLCSDKLDAGTSIPSDGLHDGTCSPSSGAAVCLSGLCNAAQDTCAVSAGETCATASQCETDACASGHCVPTSGGCWLDGDCGATSYCDRTNLLCSAQLSNGQTLPSDGLHDGTCSEALASAVCVSGGCNPITDTCAHGFGLTCSVDGQCTTNTCMGGHCVPDENGCWVDSDCGAGRFCDRTNLVCQDQLAEGEPLPNDGLHNGTCSEENATALCLSGLCNVAQNTCAAADSAGCDGAADCTSNTCSSGHCVPSDSGCWLDADCAEDEYCNRSALLCAAQLPPGAPIPDDGLHDGLCDEDNASAICSSGMCNSDSNTCAVDDGSDCTLGSECVTNVCTSSHCVPEEAGCWLDGDCDAGQYCARDTLTCMTKLGPGDPIPSDGLHDGTCSQENALALCTSGLCNDTTDTCADDNGGSCDAAADCLSNTCTSGACVPDENGCYIDSDCGSTSYCDRATLICVGRLPSGTALPDDGLHQGTCNEDDAAAVCMSGTCNATTNTCAAGDAVGCSGADECVSNTCTSSHCVPDEDGCWIDTDCGEGQYCSRTSLLCVPQLGAGDAIPSDGLHDGACSQEAALVLCASGLCNDATNTCAEDNGLGCDAAADCLSNTCTSGTCVPDDNGCYLDSDCGSTSYCNRSTLVCVGRLPAGTPLPDDGLHQSTCSELDAAAVCMSGVCNDASNTCAADDASACSARDECVSNTCTSGHCVPSTQGCWQDTDCGGDSYCDRSTLACKAKLGSGAKLPNDGLHDGGCSAESASALCASGLCNDTTDTCAEDNGAACSSAAECQSDTCLGGTCVPEEDGCNVDADCGKSSYCDHTQLTCVGRLPSGAALPKDGIHSGKCTAETALTCQSGVCSTQTNSCVSNNGASCSEDDECLTGSCGSNERCGLANGEEGCAKESESEDCQSGTCSVSGACISDDQCLVDADCSDGAHCSDGECHAALDDGVSLGDSCDEDAAERLCKSGKCNAETDTCAADNGEACEKASECASNVCEEQRCVAEPSEPPEPPSTNASFSGGGGCSFSSDAPAGRSQALLWILALGGWTYQRRRRKVAA